MSRLKSDCSSDKAVMHLIDTTGPGGAETVFIELADKMRGLGYRSVVVIRGTGWVYDQLCKRGLDPLVIPAKGSFNIKFVFALIRLIKKNRVRLIHSHLLGSNVYAALVGSLTGIPVVATYHGMVDIDPNERFRAAKNWVMRRGIRHYVTVSDRLAENVSAGRLLEMGKSSTIYNGVEMSRYHRVERRPVAEALGLASNAILVGSVGNVRKAKAYDVLIRAAALVVAQRPEVHFIVAGHKKPELMAEIDLLIDQLKLRNHVHFIGFEDDSAAFLAQLDYFVLSSTSEGFSISTIEAMATGLPVLVTRCGGPEEIVAHGETGWMVEPGDPAALAEGVLRLIDDKNLAGCIANAGKLSVNERFDISHMLGEYKTIYEKLT